MQKYGQVRYIAVLTALMVFHSTDLEYVVLASECCFLQFVYQEL